MSTLKIPHAITAPNELEPLTIIVDEPVVTDRQGLDAMRRYYRETGKELAGALLQHLPGGLIDALLLALFEQQVTLFGVSYTTRE